jgi:hypothetical protein
MNFIPLFYLKTGVLQRLINFFAYHYIPIFCRTNKMIYQNTDIVRFMYVFAFAHTYKDIVFAASGGEINP